MNLDSILGIESKRSKIRKNSQNGFDPSLLETCFLANPRVYRISQLAGLIGGYALIKNSVDPQFSKVFVEMFSIGTGLFGAGIAGPVIGTALYNALMTSFREPNNEKHL